MKKIIKNTANSIRTKAVPPLAGKPKTGSLRTNPLLQA